MKTHRITVDIDPQGGVSAEAEGFEGGACLKELERLLQGLASASEARIERKPEERRQHLSSRRTQRLGRKP